ncbi:Mercuric resistance operon regulatory protein (plasmid) [Tsukamurella tyrosinosolvens]|uniref:DNA-binding transcriptional regulator, MerR family n=1 Tax=Tsukamurella tyrosinosolvens TaxID=57704 RepID=A0A1H4WEP2_TSUTY|nr:MerR family transcriptional regulator [Tsukamurella tyrosinosolvens]AUN40891.1 MerR family transcriptional regulator [Tsukamurella tyrosinosolvens]KXO99368.1 MerR family transcriptional regulator [Tsukamurella tyrosinosolvens]RDB47102.1 MerR family transcriptional regulator [Tsukamurella tyrosinosolvens]SEC91802.1 DNA-binding transcriptional regulator, MerR family [Tsukamurella tyrosinosolvens]VEH89297.1 Mercuric resistance operon regulatory protein [Tsukamurella tyrosinosolvens]
MRIGELAERTGVSVRSLRYYEEKGLLAATRTAAGQRVYPERAVDRVVRIQELFAAGLASGVIAQLLPCIHDEDGSPNESATPWLAATLRAERDRIDAGIRDLQRAREVLDEVIDTAGEVTGPRAAAGNR